MHQIISTISLLIPKDIYLNNRIEKRISENCGVNL